MNSSRLFLFGLFAVASTGFAVADETVTPVPRDAGWMERHELISANAAAGKDAVEVVFLGDSITQGWEGDGKEVWTKFYAPRHSLNAGISGDRTQHVLWRLDHGNVDGLSPKLAVLMIGTNNSGSNTSEQIAAGVTAVVAKIREKLPKTKVLVLGVFPRGATADDPLRKKNAAANAVVAKLDDGKMVHYLALGP
ncbi:MAG: GDSL-type esterase/lipase family protein [Planctomycetia bacterium]